tara:strand:+ start:121 stop:270 length:150 start_codon:yes stop_codon:yes gene_type:complete
MSHAEIIQNAGEIIMNKYNNFHDIPLKYQFLYQQYKQHNVGVKRKFVED